MLAKKYYTVVVAIDEFGGVWKHEREAQGVLDPGWHYQAFPGAIWQPITWLEAFWRRMFLREGQRVLKVE